MSYVARESRTTLACVDALNIWNRFITEKWRYRRSMNMEICLR
jgi:hypothetical protein